MRIGRLTVSDRASAGGYEDRSGPEIERVLAELLGAGHEYLAEVVPDEPERIAAVLRGFADGAGCALAVTTGGTGIGPRDVTPEASRLALEKELPGFAEAMRMQSFARVPDRHSIPRRGGCPRAHVDPQLAHECEGHPPMPRTARPGDSRSLASPGRRSRPRFARALAREPRALPNALRTTRSFDAGTDAPPQ